MNRPNTFAAALGLGGLIGLLIGAGLPRTQAQAPAAPMAGAVDQSLAARLTRLEARVSSLDAQVRELKARPVSVVAPGGGFGYVGGGNGPWQNGGFGGLGQSQWQIVPITR